MKGILLLAATCAMPLSTDPGPQDPQDLAAEFLALLKQERIELDAEAKTVAVPAVINRVGDPLEYALIHRRGKTHEALLVTEAKPSVLNSALLALGFTPGKNATYKEKDPPPTREEVEAGADFVDVFPPDGMQLFLTVRWTVTNDAGEEVERELPIEDLILDLTTEKPVRDLEWIFLGGRMAPLYRGDPPVFVADYEGNLVSICYLEPPNHLATMKHERARDDMVWWRTDACPPPGTEVRVVFHRDRPEVLRGRDREPQASRAR